MAPEPIAPADVWAWCEMHEVPRWRQRTFWRVVQHLDKEHRRVTAERRKKEAADAKPEDRT